LCQRKNPIDFIIIVAIYKKQTQITNTQNNPTQNKPKQTRDNEIYYFLQWCRDAVNPWCREECDAVNNVMPCRREQEMGSEDEEKWSGGSEAWAGDGFWRWREMERRQWGVSRRWVLKLLKFWYLILDEQEMGSEGEEKWSGGSEAWAGDGFWRWREMERLAAAVRREQEMSFEAFEVLILDSWFGWSDCLGQQWVNREWPNGPPLFLCM